VFFTEDLTSVALLIKWSLNQWNIYPAKFTNSYLFMAMWSMCGQCFSVQADITVQTHTLLWLCDQCVGNVSAYRQISQ